MSHLTRLRYARSLAEAFPQDHAEAIEIHRRPNRWLVAALNVGMAVCIGLVFGLTLWAELTGRI